MRNYYVDDHIGFRINDALKNIKQGAGTQWTSTWRSRRSKEISFKLQVYIHDPQSTVYFGWYHKGEEVQQMIRLDNMPLTFGVRLWWLCPMCSTRCGVLFNYGKTWGCRKCGNLKYRSSHYDSKFNRIFGQLHKTISKTPDRDKLIGVASYLEPWHKPKRMRYKTWAKIMKKHNENARKCLVQTCRIAKIDLP